MRKGFSVFFKLDGRHVHQGSVGPKVVVLLFELLCLVPHLLNGLEQEGIKNLSAVCVVEPFDVAVLSWFAGLNKLKLDLVLLCP